MSANRAFVMAKQVDRVPSMRVSLDGEQERRFQRLVERVVMIDMHQHLLLLPEDPEALEAYCRSRAFAWGYDAVRAGGWTATTTANILTCLGYDHELSYADFGHLVDEIGLMLADLAKQGDSVIQVRRTDDILRAKERGQLAFIPTVEHLAIGHQVHRVDVLYGLGIRLAGLTYSRKSFIGDGQAERTDCGLSEFGVAVVRRMNELGMVIDLSHAGDQTALDAIEHSEAPLVFSHNAAHTLRPRPRSRKDRELLAAAAKGGLVCITAVPNILSDDPAQDINVVLDHYDYMVKLVGIDHVGIGTDTVIGDHVGLHRELLDRHEFPAPYLNGLESPADGRNIIRGLIARGYDDTAIDKIAGGNAIALLRRVMG